ncbi:hypothetical protein N658DRAFT_495822 [Parathielavia hyrcaniae]|uniref:Uncharacterized protein n=1 Tax=Parathielavia hyrcaniae TaxID=113614 RepID=A0AAN6Q1K3_9PEZI|nr:hypothetical protein N658DRAFT_495822 [Parathielavia hyrcaniae]
MSPRHPASTMPTVFHTQTTSTHKAPSLKPQERTDPDNWSTRARRGSPQPTISPPGPITNHHPVGSNAEHGNEAGTQELSGVGTQFSNGFAVVTPPTSISESDLRGP